MSCAIGNAFSATVVPKIHMQYTNVWFTFCVYWPNSSLTQRQTRIVLREIFVFIPTKVTGPVLSTDCFAKSATKNSIYSSLFAYIRIPLPFHSVPFWTGVRKHLHFCWFPQENWINMGVIAFVVNEYVDVNCKWKHCNTIFIEINVFFFSSLPRWYE